MRLSNNGFNLSSDCFYGWSGSDGAGCGYGFGNGDGWGDSWESGFGFGYGFNDGDGMVLNMAYDSGNGDANIICE
jgi:hypothetical protein